MYFILFCDLSVFSMSDGEDRSLLENTNKKNVCYQLKHVWLVRSNFLIFTIEEFFTVAVRIHLSKNTRVLLDGFCNNSMIRITGIYSIGHPINHRFLLW